MTLLDLIRKLKTTGVGLPLGDPHEKTLARFERLGLVERSKHNIWAAVKPTASEPTQVTVVPEPDKEMSFKVDGYVMYKGNARQVVYVINGRGGETYIGIRVPIVVEKEAKTTIIFRPESELDIILKAVA